MLTSVILVELFNSSRPALHKLLWALLVFFFPVLGLLIYFFFSNRQEYNAGAGGYQEIA